MNIPATPTEMQAFIVEQLLQNDSVPEDQTALKSLSKFSKQFGDEIEAYLQEKVFHEIQITSRETEIDEFQNFSETATSKSPISLLTQSDGQVIGVLRCDNVMRALLSRLLFGGDIASPLRPPDKPATEIEIGLQNLFASFLSQSLSKTARQDCGNWETFSAEEFDSDEVANENAVRYKYKIQVGSLKCTWEIAVLDSIVERASSKLDVEEVVPANIPNLELMQSKVAAKVKLKPLSQPLKTIQNLKVGDCIPLGSGGSLEGVFEVNGQSVYNCDIGRSGEIYCLKISERSNPQDTVPHLQPSVG